MIEHVATVLWWIVVGLVVVPSAVYLCVKCGMVAYYRARSLYSKENERDGEK